MRRRLPPRVRAPRRVVYHPPDLAPGAMPTAWCKEDLSVAYAQATGTAIGVTCERLTRDINGWDVLYRGRDTETADAAQLAVQLKCTVNRLRRIDHGRALSFPLDAHVYDNLRKTPCPPASHAGSSRSPSRVPDPLARVAP